MSLIREAVTGLKRLFVPKERGIVLALGGGGAPGLAHIGVLQVLAENGVGVRAIAGTSIGAEIGAFAAAGVSLTDFAELATRFDWKQTFQLFLPDMPAGGLVSGSNIMTFLRDNIGARRIEELAIGYVAVAADLDAGEQVVLDRGELVEAVRASISIPGIMAPYKFDGRMLVDGGVVNPLPFDVARARFGGPVVAVAVHSAARMEKPALPAPRATQWPARVRQLLDQPWMARAPALRGWLEAQLANRQKRSEKPYWVARRVLDRAYDISQAQIVRLRAQIAPPDLVLTPEVGSIGLLEFYRAREAIAAGRAIALARLDEIRKLPGAA